VLLVKGKDDHSKTFQAKNAEITKLKGDSLGREKWEEES